MTDKDLQVIRETFEDSCGWKCTDMVIEELAESAKNDVGLILKVLENIKGKEIRSPIPYLKKVLSNEAEKSRQEEAKRQRLDGQKKDNFERKYYPALLEGVIDDNEYNYMLKQHGADADNRYMKIQYRVQLWWAKQLSYTNPEAAAIQGLPLGYWQSYAFEMLAVEQKQELDMELISNEARKYKQAWISSDAFKEIGRVKPILMGMGKE